MPNQQTYKEALAAALNCLEEAEGHAMSAVLNIAFAGEHKELGILYEEGETIEIVPAMFEDTGDTNVDLVLKLVAAIKEIKESIRNLNLL